MIPNPIARRYAHALFDAAAARDRLEEIGTDLAALCAYLLDHPTARQLLRAPQIPVEERHVLTRQLFGSQVHPLVLELVCLLQEKKRTALLDDVAMLYRERVEEHGGILPAEVVSAVPLTPEVQQRIAERLSARTGKQVRLSARIDVRLLGGLRLRIGDHVIERSVRRSLDEMREVLRKAQIYA